MIEKEFPYKGWVLTPGFKPVEKTFVRPGYLGYYHKSDSEKEYHQDKIFKDKPSAIAWGRKDLEIQQAALDKKLANIEKRRAALDKAAG